MSARAAGLFALGMTLSACGGSERPILSDVLIGSCEYQSPFTNGPECRDYLGEWTLDDAKNDCTRLNSTLAVEQACQTEDVLGWCLSDDEGQQMRTHIIGTDANACGSSKFGCEFFGGGYWDPSPVCGGAGADELIVLDNVFPQPELICVDPLPGEPEGQSENGKVCTRQIISGATEEGRLFSDYADCDVIRVQRPYRPVPPNARYNEPDPRMDDPDYAADVAWVKSQLSSSACTCCHDDSAPEGPSVFDLTSDGNMLNQFNDRGIAMGTGWISTVGFGAWPPEENNGFERSDLEHPNHSIFPTTDMQRMISIFMREAEHRGITEADFENELYGAGPLDALRQYEPQRCTIDEGVDADGTLRWLPGRARYAYVLEAGTISPTVPPNLDIPEGTLWRVDLAPSEYPVASGTIKYGEIPEGMEQRFPADGSAPKPLVSGEDYYLYVTADILFPISRCIFTAK